MVDFFSKGVERVEGSCRPPYLCAMVNDMVSLVHGGIEAEISLIGAELQGLRKVGGGNVLWTKNDEIWNRVAPNLFPIVGRLKNDAYTVEGRSFSMRQHGFARDQRFELLERDETSVLLGLRYSEATFQVYPYAFEFQVRYRIEDKVLWVEYITKNVGEGEMLYSVGGHPGFALRGALAGHALRFTLAGEVVSFRAPRRLIEGGYYSGATEDVEVLGGELLLDDALFASDAIVFNEPPFDAVSLLDAQGDVLVDFYCWEWDAVGFWTKKDAPFFCIEPWWGWADDASGDGDFSEKAGLHRLEAGDSETVTYGLGLR